MSRLTHPRQAAKMTRARKAKHCWSLPARVQALTKQSFYSERPLS